MDIRYLSRIMGVFWIIASVLWAVFALLGLFYGLNFLERLQIDLENNLDLIIESLDSVCGLVGESTDIISSTYQSLDTVQISLNDASVAVEDLRPLLWRTRNVVTSDIPEALDGVQDSMPSLIATAKSIDETLTWLSNFGFTIPNPFGADWSYDLGIDYAPEVPLDQALESMSGNLDELPDDLREMKENLNTTDENLVTVSDDLAFLATDLEALNQEIADINPQLDVLDSNIEGVQNSFVDIREGIPKSVSTARKILIGVLGLLFFTQIPMIYMGWILASRISDPSI